MYKPPPRRFKPSSREHIQIRDLMASLWAQCPPEREATFFDNFRHKNNLDSGYAAQLFTQVKQEATNA